MAAGWRWSLEEMVKRETLAFLRQKIHQKTKLGEVIVVFWDYRDHW